MPQTPQVFEADVRVPTRLRYLLSLPAGHAERADWPLLLFLHGMGERGDDVAQVANHGPPRLLAEGRELPFVVVSPQCPDGEIWSQHLPSLMALVDDVAARCRVDPERLLLTGLSLGGMGICHLAAAYPERFAALAPVCAGATTFLDPARLAHLPMWAFHGEADDVVPVAASHALVERHRAVGGEARLTLYPDVRHDAWNPAYATEELYDWLLARRRPVRRSS